MNTQYGFVSSRTETNESIQEWYATYKEDTLYFPTRYDGYRDPMEPSDDLREPA